MTAPLKTLVLAEAVKIWADERRRIRGYRQQFIGFFGGGYSYCALGVGYAAQRQVGMPTPPIGKETLGTDRRVARWLFGWPFGTPLLGSMAVVILNDHTRNGQEWLYQRMQRRLQRALGKR